MPRKGTYLRGYPVAQLALRQRQLRIARSVLARITPKGVGIREGLTNECVRRTLFMTSVHAIRLTMQRPWPAPLVGSVRSRRSAKGFRIPRFKALGELWCIPKERTKRRTCIRTKAGLWKRGCLHSFGLGSQGTVQLQFGRSRALDVGSPAQRTRRLDITTIHGAMRWNASSNAPCEFARTALPPLRMKFLFVRCTTAAFLDARSSYTRHINPTFDTFRRRGDIWE